jgi:XTP/dITP diphosphohydrolase/ATP diphosphatase
VPPEPSILDEPSQNEAAAALAQAAAIMARLRAPGGCPWDREQTFDSIRRHTLEETYEVFDAIERRAWPELKDELGDLFLQVLFYAQMASEAGYFTLRDVANALSAKLIRRHPHVFADAVATDSDAVLHNWEQIKREEKLSQPVGAQMNSMLEDIPRSMPAMLEATKLGSRAAKVGFDWPEIEGLFDKLAEETAELRSELAIASKHEERDERIRTERIEDELGDLLFTAVHLARHLQLDPEFALRKSNAKFRRRFAAMEGAGGRPAALESLSAEQLDALWNQAKKNEQTATTEHNTPKEQTTAEEQH